MKSKIYTSIFRTKDYGKEILFSVCVLFSCSLNAQLSLTQSFNEPKPGDVETTYRMDTSAYTSGLPNSVSGNNVVWNFTNLKGMEPAFTSNYLSAASVTSAASYTNCNLVQESGGAYTYFKSATTPTTQTELLGINVYSLAATFTNTGIIAKYPINFGSTSSDNLSGTFTSTVSGTCSGTINTTADGAGTLNLPGNITLTNVLRVKSSQTVVLTATFVPVATLKQTLYNYYHASQKFPVLSVSYDYLTSIFISNPTVNGSVMGSTNYFVVGINEITLESNAVKLYPNPSQGELNIDLQNGLNLLQCKIYNQLGELVLLSKAEHRVNISNLNAGLYSIEVLTDKGVLRKKIVKE